MSETKKFQRKIEDFVCEKCGHKNIGDGYTNHCQKCLYSKHVDINPGDRGSDCGGLMEPIETTNKGDVLCVTHKCLKCGFKKKNKISDADDFSEVIKISTESTEG